MVASRYNSPYKYQCSMGHWLEGPEPILMCPVIFQHHPCPGSLKRIGGTREKVSK